MSLQLVDRSIDDVCAEVCSNLDGDAYLINPSASLFTTLVDWGVKNPESFTPLSVIGDEATFKQALSTFPVASRTAELLESELIKIRTHPEPPKSSIAIDGDRLVALIDAGERFGALSTDECSFVDELHETCIDSFDHADQLSLRTPALSRVESTLEERFGADRRQEFFRLVNAAPFEGPVDEVIISLLVAAKHGDLLYEISNWGEDIGLASKATFSRKKSILENANLIGTESEPIDVGRPRLRLHLADISNQNLSAKSLIEITRERLA